MTQAATRDRCPRIMALAAILTCTLAMASAARAQSWSETGDAGDLISTAQATIGTGALTQLGGNLASPTDVDIYCIQIPSTPPAGAPLLQLLCFAVQSPNLWLFDSNGNGVVSGGTCAGGYKTITAPNVSLAPGTYYVAISYYGYDPQSSGGAIWLAGSPFQRAPDGPGAAGALTGWAGTPSIQGPNPYQLTLSYISYCGAATPTLRRTWGAVKLIYR